MKLWQSGTTLVSNIVVTLSWVIKGKKGKVSLFILDNPISYLSWSP